MIDNDLEDLKARVGKLEAAVFNEEGPSPIDYGRKQVTLPEIARKETVKSTNGQQKVSIIVGYYEKIAKKQAISKADISSGWIDGKFKGVYKTTFVGRAVTDGLIRDRKGDNFDLTQTGEDFFKGVMDATENSAGTKN